MIHLCPLSYSSYISNTTIYQSTSICFLPHLEVQGMGHSKISIKGSLLISYNMHLEDQALIPKLSSIQFFNSWSILQEIPPFKIKHSSIQAIEGAYLEISSSKIICCLLCIHSSSSSWSKWAHYIQFKRSYYFIRWINTFYSHFYNSIIFNSRSIPDWSLTKKNPSSIARTFFFILGCGSQIGE